MVSIKLHKIFIKYHKIDKNPNRNLSHMKVNVKVKWYSIIFTKFSLNLANIEAINLKPNFEPLISKADFTVVIKFIHNLFYYFFENL